MANLLELPVFHSNRHTFPNACIKYMAFAHSHDGGLVGFDESQKLCVLLFIMLADCSINF